MQPAVPQTAEQINLPQTGAVTLSRPGSARPVDVKAIMARSGILSGPSVVIAAEDPDALSRSIAGSRVAVELKADQNFTLSLKLPRDRMIEEVKNARQVPMAWQEIILAEIAVIDPKHELLRLDFIRHGHGGGMNAVLTVKEI